MTRLLKISQDLSLPLDAVTQTFGILAVRGAGKTYLAAVLAEEFVHAGLRVCAVDLVGVLWGLRSSADGKSPGLPIVIIGGEHADVPLEPTAGTVIADFVVDETSSCVLDLSLMRKGEQQRFMVDFAERLYQKNREPLHLILDEADAFAPQRPLPGQQRMLGAVEDLVRRGRARGIGITLATQRAAVLNKDVLTQIETLVAMRTISPQDRAAVDAWIKVHGDEALRQEVLGSLPSLKKGEAWFWSPAWLGVLKRVQVRKRLTFDSSATPTAGAKRIAPKAFAEVNLDALRARVASTIEKAKQEDPRHLRARIAELERAAAETKRAPQPTPAPVVAPALHHGLPEEIEELLAIAKEHEACGKRLAKFALRYGRQTVRVGGHLITTPRRAPDVQPAPTNGHAKLASGERKILNALAPYAAGRTKRQVALLTGYAVGGGGFGNLLSSLRTRGFIEGTDTMRITDAGRTALGPVEPLPTGAALRSRWLQSLGKAERLILEALCDAYPRTLDKEELGRRTDYEPTGGGFGNALSRLRTLELIHGRAEMRASDDLFN